MRIETIPAGYKLTIDCVGYHGGDETSRSKIGLSEEQVREILQLIAPYRISGDFIKETDSIKRVQLQTKFLSEAASQQYADDFSLIGYNGKPRLVISTRIAFYPNSVEIHHYHESEL